VLNEQSPVSITRFCCALHPRPASDIRALSCLSSPRQRVDTSRTPRSQRSPSTIDDLPIQHPSVCSDSRPPPLSCRSTTLEHAVSLPPMPCSVLPLGMVAWPNSWPVSGSLQLETPSELLPFAHMAAFGGAMPSCSSHGSASLTATPPLLEAPRPVTP
jgi:hypothetical protein